MEFDPQSLSNKAFNYQILQLCECYLRLPAFSNDICNCRIHMIRNVETAMLETNCTNNLHWVHSHPWLLHCREFPQYNSKTINITSAWNHILCNCLRHPCKGPENNRSEKMRWTYFSFEGSFLRTSGAIHSA